MRKLFCFVLLFLLVPTTGCPVPQPRGEGLYRLMEEPTTKARYHLYLPKDYVAHSGRHPYAQMKKWPLVMSFHGMKPYDNALPQEREWEKEADFYGFVVCAPQLETSDSFMEYPLTREHDYVLRDRQNVIAVMDHVFATTNADPQHVLATSWSCGGYLAHYFANRFPDRFSCIATRLSNFSSALMIEDTVPMYRDRVPVAIFIGDGDFPACKTESEEAVAWYMARGFRTVRGKMIDDMGHRRIPQTAAAFFAEHMNLEPLHPADAANTLAKVQMIEYFPPQEMIARLSPKSGSDAAAQALAANLRRSAEDTASARTISPEPETNSYNIVSAGKRYPSGKVPSYNPNPQPPAPQKSAPPEVRLTAADRRGNPLEPIRNPQAAPRGKAETSRDSARRSNPADLDPISGGSAAPGAASARPSHAATSRARRINIRLGGPAIGTSPHYLSYGVDLPAEIANGADFLWTDNGVWIGDEPQGSKVLESPGLHRISVLVVSRDGTEYRGQATVQVLEKGGRTDSGKRAG